MEKMRTWALRAIVLLILIATLVAFGESYAGLFQWAEHHQIVGFWGGVWPLMVDVIVLAAECGLFVGHYDKWLLRHRAWLWSILMVALGVSVGGNTGHIQSTDWLTHLTAALPPLALAFALTVGFGTMKRTFQHKQPVQPVAPVAPVPAAEPIAPAPHLGERYHVGTTPWVSVDPATLTEMRPITRTRVETPSEPYLETPLTETPERPAPVLPPDDFDLSETLLTAGFKVTEKSFTMPGDPRKGIDLKRKRVRDAYDVDPDVTANALAKALEISWATAAKYLAETKEARGLELTEQERRYISAA